MIEHNNFKDKNKEEVHRFVWIRDFVFKRGYSREVVVKFVKFEKVVFRVTNQIRQKSKSNAILTINREVSRKHHKKLENRGFRYIFRCGVTFNVI